MNGKCVFIFFLCLFYSIITSCLYNFHHTFSVVVVVFIISFISWVFHLFVFFTTLTVTFSLRLFCVFRDLFLYLPFAFEKKRSYIWYFKSSQEICNEKIYLYDTIRYDIEGRFSSYGILFVIFDHYFVNNFINY